MDINSKLDFFGILNEMVTRSEQALKHITALWEEGSIRLKEDELKQMNELLGIIWKNLKETERFNHDKFGKITKEAVEARVAVN